MRMLEWACDICVETESEINPFISRGMRNIFIHKKLGSVLVKNK